MERDHSRATEGNVEYKELFDAASEGDLEHLEAALLPSLDINALEPNHLQGRTALHVASQTGNVEAIQFLLTHGAKVDLRNSEYRTPLHDAAFNAQPEAIKALLKGGASIHLQTGDYNFTALHDVLKFKDTVTPEQIKTIELLLDQGSDVNADADGWGSTLVGLDVQCLRK